MGEPLSPNTSASISAVEREWESRLISKNLELAESETRLLRTESALEAASSLTEKLSEELSTAKRDSRDIIEHLERTLQGSKLANDEVTAALHDKTQNEERQSQHIAKLEKELARQKDKLEQALEFEKEHHKLLRRVAELEERVRETEVTANTEMVMRHQEHNQRLAVEEDNINLRRELSKSVHESRVFGYPWSVRLVLSPLPLHAKGAVIAPSLRRLREGSSHQRLEVHVEIWLACYLRVARVRVRVAFLVAVLPMHTVPASTRFDAQSVSRRGLPNTNTLKELVTVVNSRSLMLTSSGLLKICCFVCIEVL